MPSVRKSLRRIIFLLYFAATLVALLVIPMSITQGWLDPSWTAVANGLLIVVIASIAVLAILAGISWMAYRALALGDYGGALRWAVLPGPHAAEFRARALALGGRLPESEKILRHLAGRERDPKRRATLISQLSDVLLEQGRFAEAKDCLDQALKLDIGHGGPCNEMASWYLRQGLDPQTALEFVDRAMEAQRQGFAAARSLMPSRLVNRAWALARLGRRAEAEAEIAEAMRLQATLKLAASKGFLHVTAGNAYAAMDQPAKAREHFEQAAALDPHGIYGKRARAALQSS